MICGQALSTCKVMEALQEQRGYGAVGSAPHWQCGGHGFESR